MHEVRPHHGRQPPGDGEGGCHDQQEEDAEVKPLRAALVQGQLDEQRPGVQVSLGVRGSGVTEVRGVKGAEGLGCRGGGGTGVGWRGREWWRGEVSLEERGSGVREVRGVKGRMDVGL